MNVFTHLDLFAGIGGFSYAARLIGWETKAWCEINPICQQVLKYHFPKAEGFTDITKTDFTKYEKQIEIKDCSFILPIITGNDWSEKDLQQWEKFANSYIK